MILILSLTYMRNVVAGRYRLHLCRNIIILVISDTLASGRRSRSQRFVLLEHGVSCWRKTIGIWPNFLYRLIKIVLYVREIQSRYICCFFSLSVMWHWALRGWWISLSSQRGGPLILLNNLLRENGLRHRKRLVLKCRALIIGSLNVSHRNCTSCLCSKINLMISDGWSVKLFLI